jgi:stage II sporulation protein M
LLERLKTNILLHIRHNLAIYLIVFFAFLTGIASGAFTIGSMSLGQKEQLGNHIHQFFDVINSQSIDRFAIFTQSIWQHIQTLFFLWLFGLFFLGFPLVLVTVGIRGFFIGFTVGFLVGHYGFGGFLFSLICVLPQTLLYIPCFIGMGVCSLSFSTENFKKRKFSYSKNDKYRRVTSYTMILLTFFIILFMGSIFETFITPIFFGLFKWVFV